MVYCRSGVDIFQTFAKTIRSHLCGVDGFFLRRPVSIGRRRSESRWTAGTSSGPTNGFSRFVWKQVNQENMSSLRILFNILFMLFSGIKHKLHIYLYLTRFWYPRMKSERSKHVMWCQFESWSGRSRPANRLRLVLFAEIYTPSIFWVAMFTTYLIPMISTSNVQ